MGIIDIIYYIESKVKFIANVVGTSIARPQKK